MVVCVSVCLCVLLGSNPQPAHTKCMLYYWTAYPHEHRFILDVTGCSSYRYSRLQPCTELIHSMGHGRHGMSLGSWVVGGTEWESLCIYLTIQEQGKLQFSKLAIAYAYIPGVQTHSLQSAHTFGVRLKNSFLLLTLFILSPMGLGFWALQTKWFILGLPHERENPVPNAAILETTEFT